MGIQGVSQPGKVDVQAAQGHHFALGVEKGLGIGGDGQRVRPVQDRVGPEGHQRIPGPEVVLVHGIVMGRTGYLRKRNASILSLAGAGLIKAADGRIEIGDEGHARSHYVRVVVYQACHSRKNRVRMGQAANDVPLVLCHRGLRQREHVLDLVDPGLHRRMAAQLHFFGQHAADAPVLHDGDELHQDGGHHDNPETGSSQLFFKDFIAIRLSNGKVIICF